MTSEGRTSTPRPHGQSIEIPIEDFEPGDEGKVARLNLSLYGTREAAQNWAKEYTTFLQECGFKTGLASPCNFERVNRELNLTVHGDDFTVTGPTAGLQWMQRRMEQKYEIKAPPRTRVRHEG